MVLSRQNFINVACVIAAFSLGGFFALQTGTPNSQDVSIAVSETAHPQSAYSSTPPVLKNKHVQIGTAAASNAAPTNCDQSCQADTAKVQAWSRDIGRASEGGLDKAEEYAAYIKVRPALRDELIRRAENQSDGNLSRLLVASFKYLEPPDKLELSRALMTSPAWDIRRKTTALLTSPDVLNSQNEAELVAIMSQETDPRIAAPVLKALGQNVVAKDKPEIMNFINSQITDASDADIRGAALIAQTQLTLSDVTKMPPQVLESMQSNDSAYKSYGFRAADLVLSKLHKADAGAEDLRFQATRRALEDIRNSKFDVVPERVFAEAEDLYFRYFQ